TVDDPTVEDGSYVLDGTLPDGKDGRHLIYAIWQRTDSPEAFYSCSDVVFGDEGTTEGGAGDDNTGSGDSEHGQSASDETAGDATDAAASGDGDSNSDSDSDNTGADSATAVADSDGDSEPGAAAVGENGPRASGSNQPDAESAAAADTATEDLAYTGVDSSTILIIGGALVVAGTGAVL